MIRTLRQCSGLAARVPQVSRTIGEGQKRGVLLVAESWLSSTTDTDCSRQLSTAAHAQDAMLPPNIQFDKKSSFAPRDVPILKAPAQIVEEELAEDEVEASDAEAVENEDDTEEEEDYFDFAEDDLDTKMPQFVVPLPDRLKVDIHHRGDGSVTGSLHLEQSVFGVDPIRIDLIKQSVDYIRNKIRGRRKAKTKTISEVSGSGRKVKQQKGTGGARAGHSRPAHWRGGAKAHGPKNTTDYGNVKMNKKAKRLAMVSVLSQKLKEGNLVVVDDLMLDSHRTAPWSSLLSDSFDIGKDGASALIVDHYLEDSEEEASESPMHASFNGVPINLWVASGNVAKVKVVNQRFANVYDILRKDKLVLTLGAIKAIESQWMD